MKKLLLTLLVTLATVTAWAQDDAWKGLGTGSYQPGILDFYNDEYTELLPAAVYESTTQPGVYKFVPSTTGTSALVVYEIVVHAENPDKVWCESATFFRGIMNYSVVQKVTEAQPPFGASDQNYGKMKDGAITFTTPNSFLAMELSGYKNSNINGKFALFMPGVNPVDDPIVNDTWTPMGKGKYIEGLLDCEYELVVMWEIDVEKSEEHPGCYRIKPYYEGNPSCPKLPEIADTYIYIHAENEMEVYTTPVIFLNSQGKGYKVEHRAVTGSDPDFAYYGTLEDGIITFPANSHRANIVGIAGAGSVLTNTSGKATIALPGADVKDYYVEVTHTICAESTGDHFCKFPIILNGGKDVAGIALVVEAGVKTLDELDIAKYMQGGTTIFPSMFFGIQYNINFPMVAEEYHTNRWTLIAIAVDANGQPHDVKLTTFFTPEEDKDWADYATGTFTDLIMGPPYLAFNPTYNLMVQKKKGSVKQLRLVNPYIDNPEIKDEQRAAHADHNHYIYINADDPNYVYIEEAPLGLDMGYNQVVASSIIGHKMNCGATIEEIKAMGIQGGTLANDAITFPANSLMFFETGYKDGMLQECGSGLLLRLSDLPVYDNGDVNGDGTIDIADVNIVINLILGNDSPYRYDGRGDVNGDGTIDIADVNAIINIILG